MKSSKTKFAIVLCAACLTGLLLGKIDTSENWDDTGVTAGLVFISAMVFGFIRPGFAWLWAIIIGGTIFFFNTGVNGNYGSVAAIVFAFMGAYLGFVCRKYVAPSRRKS